MQKNYFTLFCYLLSISVLLAQGGTLDPSFNGTGIIDFKYQNIRTGFRQLQLLHDGKILAFGFLSDDQHIQSAIFRFNPDGSLDHSFGNEGAFTTPNVSPYHIGYDGIVLPDGKIMVIDDVAYKNEIALTRLLPEGIIDSSYSINGISSIFLNINPYYSPAPTSAIRQADGKIVLLAGYWDFDSDLRRAFAMRVLPDGNVDSTFGTAGIVDFIPSNNDWKLEVFGGKIQPDGKIVVAGRTGSTVANQVWYIARLMPDGSFDTSFDGDGVINPNIGNVFSEAAYEIYLLPDGKIIGAGYGQKLPGQQMVMMRFQPNGAVDNTFGLGGKAFVDFGCCHSYINDIIQQPDGKLVVCGSSDEDNVHHRFSVARVKANGLVDPEFGDQGKVVVEINHDSTSAFAAKILLQPDGKILVIGSTLDEVDGYANSGLLVRLNPGTVGTTAAPHAVNDPLVVSPNPVSGNSIQVSYTLPMGEEIWLSLIDVLGQKVRVLLNAQWRSEGQHVELLRLPDELPIGQYLMRLETKNHFQMTKMLKIE
ncbi:MAG: hypothetical protein ACKVU0_06215 [Saprospiraceae bacterium]